LLTPATGPFAASPQHQRNWAIPAPNASLVALAAGAQKAFLLPGYSLRSLTQSETRKTTI
jgi:hypothetical protein